MNKIQSIILPSVFGVIAAGSGTAFAVDITVNNRSDVTNSTLCTPASQFCTLRKAMEIVDSRPTEFFKIFLQAQGNYPLTRPLKLTAGSVEITSTSSDPSLVVLDGTNSKSAVNGLNFGIFEVEPASGRSPSLTLVSVTLANSSSSQAGGAVKLLAGGTLAIRGSVVRNHKINSRGGGLFLEAGTTTNVNNTTFENNRSASFPDCLSGTGGGLQGAGGAIATQPGASLVIANSFFTGNQACRGGAIFSEGSKLDISNSTFTGNEASARGGAIFLSGRSTSDVAFLRFNTIARNTAGAQLVQIFSNELTHSGGIALVEFTGRLVLSGNIFAENTVPFQGETRVKNAVGTKGADCLMENSTPAIDTYNNFFGTAGATTTNRVGTAMIGSPPSLSRQLSDCIPLRSKSFAGIDSRILNPQLSAPALSGTTFPLQLPVMMPASSSIVNNSFRDGSTSTSRHVCLSGDQRGFVRPQQPFGICEIGAAEIDGAQ